MKPKLKKCGNGDKFENKKKKIKIEPNVLGDDFEAPDGGWGWMIIVACGISNLCVLPILQNFGLIFLERFTQLGLSSSQITTVINVNMATTAVLGLANGPMFKKFSFRQVAFVGGLLCSIATIFLSMSSSFTQIFISMSIFHAAGMGVTLSANALALNTYFKKKRRIAVGLSWTCTGFGPIIMPQIITALIPKFDVSGTVFILGAFTLNALASALLLQPVSWHAKKISNVDQIHPEAAKEKDDVVFSTKVSKDDKNNSNQKLEKYSSLSSIRQGFGSQYLFYDDEENGAAGIDVISPETPMISRANDGWFSNSTQTLAINRTISMKHINKQTSESENGRLRKGSYQEILSPPMLLIDESQKKLLKKGEENNEEVEEKLLKSEANNEKNLEEEEQSQITQFLSAIVIFFDLGLLKDYVFVILMLGLNFALFVEMNFSILTPFILSDHGLSKQQVATVLSLLAATDVAFRFLISFIASKIGWSNRTFFLVGIGCISVGRIIFAHVSSYNVIIVVSLLIGFGKALRTIFMALVIPSHVPLSRLPAASGLQLVSSGIIYPSLGPLLGWIRDTYGNYQILLYVFNIITLIIILSWTLEAWITSKKNNHNNLNNNKSVA